MQPVAMITPEKADVKPELALAAFCGYCTFMAIPTTLAAVLFVELADFNDLVSADERAAVEALAGYRRAADPVILSHSGDIVDATGSELLVVFTSAVAAVQCAMHLGLELGSLRVAGPEPRAAAEAEPGSRRGTELRSRVRARAGLHLGEIWRESGRVYGNGVNVAARVMQAAPAGALYLSEDVYRQVEAKLDLVAREVGGVELKNIARPLALYEIDYGRGFASADDSTAAAARGGAEPPVAPTASSVPAAEPPVAPAASSVSRVASVRAVAEPPVAPIASSVPGRASAALGESIAREVARSLSGLPGAKLTREGGDLSLTIGDAASGGKPVSPALERARRVKRLASSIRSLVIAAALGGALGYGFAVTNQWYYALGALCLGLLPFLGSLKKLLAAASSLRRLKVQDS